MNKKYIIFTGDRVSEKTRNLIDNLESELNRLEQEKEDLIKYLKEKIEICSDFSEELNDEVYIGKTKAYEEILEKVKSGK